MSSPSSAPLRRSLGTTRTFVAAAAVAALFGFGPVLDLPLSALAAATLACGLSAAALLVRHREQIGRPVVVAATGWGVAGVMLQVVSWPQTKTSWLSLFGPIAATWFIALSLWRASTQSSASAPSDEPGPYGAAALALLAGAVIAFVHFAATPHWGVVSDEAVYLLQSDWFSRSNYGWAPPEPLRDHFMMRKLGVSPNGTLYGMYSPGWPAVLWMLKSVGLRWWSGVVLGMLSIFGLSRLGRAVGGARVGVLAALLLAVNPWFYLWHAGYMSHALSMCLAIWAATWLVEGEEAHGAARAWRHAAVGGTLALLVATRPLAGLAISASLACWVLLRRRRSPSKLATDAVVAVLGATPIIAWFLHYNLVTNGEALRSSYAAIHGSGYTLGFGLRGLTGLDANVQRVAIPTTHTVGRATEALLLRSLSVAQSGIGAGLALPLVAFAVALGFRIRWGVLLAFLALPIAHYFYWASELRLWAEMFPFICLGLAVALGHIWNRNEWLGRHLLAASVGSALVLALPGRWAELRTDEPFRNTAYVASRSRGVLNDSLVALANERGPLLVIVRERMPLLDALIDRVYQLNTNGEASQILVARDLGARNEQLRRAFPSRTAVLVTDVGARVTPTIEILPAIDR